MKASCALALVSALSAAAAPTLAVRQDAQSVVQTFATGDGDCSGDTTQNFVNVQDNLCYDVSGQNPGSVLASSDSNGNEYSVQAFTSTDCTTGGGTIVQTNDCATATTIGGGNLVGSIRFTAPS